jgi:DNA-binding transcriptional LysR family regulator
MDLHHLRTFVAVAELKHVTQAAERLHLSQPAASAHIKALEESLGITLFERRASGLLLTPAGQELLRLAQDVLGAAATLDAKAREIGNAVSGAFRLGVRVDMLLVRLGPFVRGVRERHPKLALELYQLSTMNILGGIRSGDLDAGFILISKLPPGVTGVELETVPYRVVAPPEWRDVIRDADAGTIAKLPWIGSARGGSHDQMLDAVLGEANQLRQRVIESDYEVVHASLVEAGVGLALMRQDLAIAAEVRGAVVVWQGAVPCSTMRYVFAERRVKEPAIRAMRDLVVRYWTDRAST